MRLLGMGQRERGAPALRLPPSRGAAGRAREEELWGKQAAGGRRKGPCVRVCVVCMCVHACVCACVVYVVCACVHVYIMCVICARFMYMRVYVWCECMYVYIVCMLYVCTCYVCV